MNSRTTERFWRSYQKLPEEIREQARTAYRLFRQNPHHSSLRFKQVHQREPIYSVRVGRHYRAVGFVEGDTIIWFWMGTHAEYDHLLRQI